ncbi:MAG TPA: SufD family Fe-S cluster assembly protein [Thermoleophilaceae bacterium]|nr:SufD family Fe-S cluster assembly protein [Thermoleophilaceae bacterium]
MAEPAGSGPSVAPAFLEERRREALEAYEREPVPTWRRSGFWTTHLRGLALDELEPRRHEPVESIGELPAVVAGALPELLSPAAAGGEPAGGEDGGRSAIAEPEAPDSAGLSGLLVQRGASTVYSWLDRRVAESGVIMTSLERAVEDHADLVEAWYMRRLSHEEGKFQAASAAFWTGGAFVHVPRNVRLERPLQVIYLIDEPGTAQYAHTLGVVDEHAECAVREYCLAPEIEGQALHAGAFELYVRPGARVKLAHLQDWGSGEVYDISTKRVEIARDAHCSWVPVHLGGRLTKQTLDIVTAERGSDMRHTGLYFTEGNEHLDLFTTDLHEQGDTTGDTVWKGALSGESRASYEGLIHIARGAQNTHTYLQTHSMLLSPRAKGDAIPSLIVETDNVSASHGGTVGEIDEEQVFYMMSRGIPRAEAVRTLVEGYFEEVVQRLDDESLERVVRDRIAAKLAGAEEQVAAFTAER